MQRTVLLALLTLIFAAADAQQTGDECAPVGDVRFICGPTNAEDLVRVPDTDWLVASGMGGGASLTLIDSVSKDWYELYPGAMPAVDHDTATYGACPGVPDPSALVTHGLAIRAGEESGHSTLFAVGHGARETIEVFDVDATGPRPSVTWIGCVPMPAGLDANSVAALPGGGLVATVLVLPGSSFTDQLAGRPTGAVFEWRPGREGFERLAGSELPGNNGIEVSADGREIYVVSSGLHTITAFTLTNPVRRLRESAALPFTPDNVHRGPDGRLLTAGMKDDVPACGGPPGPGHSLEQLSTCPRGFLAVALDPATLRDELVAESPAIDVFSNATMVLTHGGEFYIGTFSGDRIAWGTLD